MISANSFCIRLAEVLSALDILGFGFVSLASLTGAVAAGGGGVASVATGGGGEAPLLPLWPAASCCWTLLLDGPAPVDMKTPN